jgi:CTP synthase (UTP-ammonia lyase)
MTSIAILGDFDPTNETHTATDTSLKHAAAALGKSLDAKWLPTDQLLPNSGEASERTARLAASLDSYDGVWIAAGSPYRDMDAVLAAIAHVRSSGIPTIGTCGGFQHIVLEYGRSVLGLAEAHHAEYDPYASVLFVSKLACSLVGKRMIVSLRPGTLAARLYERNAIEENYYCNFTLNPEYQPRLEQSGMMISGSDADAAARIVELPTHPFFLGTLFVPQVASTAERPHPLILGFVDAAATRRNSR